LRRFACEAAAKEVMISRMGASMRGRANWTATKGRSMKTVLRVKMSRLLLIAKLKTKLCMNEYSKPIAAVTMSRMLQILTACELCAPTIGAAAAVYD
jgi:hypothetical protein